MEEFLFLAGDSLRGGAVEGPAEGSFETLEFRSGEGDLGGSDAGLGG